MKKILSLDKIEIRLSGNRKNILKKISFDLFQGEFLGIIGESGCGKTTLLHFLQGILDKNQFLWEGNIEYFTEEKPKVTMILQDSIRCLNPYETIGKQLRETYLFHHPEIKKEKCEEEIFQILLSLGLEETKNILQQYPNQLSGGMRQRIAIALILCCKTDILLADEPTTSLDAMNQFRFLELLRETCQKRNITLVYVSHDLRVLMQLCQRVIAMKEGEIVEIAKTEDFWENPKHDYSKKLIASIQYFL